MNVTINELSKKTGVSSYEIRRRVHSGTLPHTRVGAKQSKILIDEDIFKRLLMEESLGNMETVKNISISDNADNDSIGYSRLRKID